MHVHRFAEPLNQIVTQQVCVPKRTKLGWVPFSTAFSEEGLDSNDVKYIAAYERSKHARTWTYHGSDLIPFIHFPLILPNGDVSEVVLINIACVIVFYVSIWSEAFTIMNRRGKLYTLNRCDDHKGSLIPTCPFPSLMTCDPMICSLLPCSLHWYTFMWVAKRLLSIIYNHVVLSNESHLNVHSYSLFSPICMIKHDMQDMCTTLISHPNFQQD